VRELPEGEAELRREVEGFRALVGDVRQGSPRLPALEAAGRRLYDLLVAPVEDLVAGEARLLLLPEGPLHLLPWAALRRRAAAAPAGEAAAETYLAEWKPVQLALSATAYAELKRARGEAPPGEAHAARAHLEPDHRPAVGHAGAAAGLGRATLAVFGDPRYRRASAGADSSSPDPAWRAAATRGCRFEPLPQTRREAEEIGRLWGDGARVYLGEQATEERVKAVAPEVGVLHVAAHGCLDERFPLNSALALTLSEGAAESRDNGLLQAWEIFESLRLSADLVVLSACDSALGKEVAGEGLLGLTRAFHYAGARSVAASLWQVPDEATADLMVRFHRHLRQGEGKGEALRAAQAELLAGAAGEEARAPYFWAGFQLFGDWR